MIIEIENGKLKYSIEDSEIHIENIEVIEKRKGTGRILIDKIKSVACDMGMKIVLYAEPQNDSISQDELRKFYESCGFQLHPDDIDYSYYTWG